MLATEFPDVVIEMSGVEGFGLKLNNTAWSRIFGSGFGLAAGTAAGIAANIYLPGSLFPVGALTGWVTNNFIAPKVDPFKSGGLLATRATVFRLMR